MLKTADETAGKPKRCVEYKIPCACGGEGQQQQEGNMMRTSEAATPTFPVPLEIRCEQMHDLRAEEHTGAQTLPAITSIRVAVMFEIRGSHHGFSWPESA